MNMVKNMTFLVALAVLFPTDIMAATILNSGDKAVVIIVSEGARRRDYSIDPQKQISVCLKGCFMTLPDGDRYALKGEENVEVSGSRIIFH